MMDCFTLQEINLICLYHSSDRAATIAQMRDALAEIPEPDVHGMVRGVIRKLAALDDSAYDRLEFDPSAPIGLCEEYGGVMDGGT